MIAVDTSTPAVTAGLVLLADDSSDCGITVLATTMTLDARAHAELLTPHILQCLADADIGAPEVDAVVVGTGPGPYTGLRVGMATASAFGDALSIPVYGVCSLDGIAAEVEMLHKNAPPTPAGAESELLVVTDARRRELYWARYRAGVRVGGPGVAAPDAVDTGNADRAAGSPVHAELFGLPVADVASPSVRGLVVAALADLRTCAQPRPLSPLYLRRPDAATLEERRAARSVPAQQIPQ